MSSLPGKVIAEAAWRQEKSCRLFLFRGLYLTAKMVYYKCEVFYE